MEVVLRRTKQYASTHGITFINNFEKPAFAGFFIPYFYLFGYKSHLISVL